jgi:hypothetical protein
VALSQPEKSFLPFFSGSLLTFSIIFGLRRKRSSGLIAGAFILIMSRFPNELMEWQTEAENCSICRDTSADGARIFIHEKAPSRA